MTLYDLMLNTDRVSVALAVDLLRETLRAERFQPTAAARQDVADRSLTVQAQATLLAHPVTRALRLAVECRNGEILLRGTVDQEEHQKTAEALLARLPGVTGVRSAIVFVPPRPAITSL